MQGEKQYKTGLDVGSTTAKIVIIDESGQTVFSRYERHNAQVNDLLSAYFREARQELGDIETSIAVTGSVGMGTAEQLRTEFIQDNVANIHRGTLSHCFQTFQYLDVFGRIAPVIGVNLFFSHNLFSLL